MADMCDLPAYGASTSITCLDDALNHLPSAGHVQAALRAMGANLARGGLLAFDVNTLAAYRDVGDRIVEDGERIVLWHGGPARLDAPGGRAEVAMDVLSRCDDGLWRRASASWGHWHYPLASIPGRSPRAPAWRSSRSAASARAACSNRDADEERHQKAVFLAPCNRRRGKEGPCPGAPRSNAEAPHHPHQPDLEARTPRDARPLRRAGRGCAPHSRASRGTAGCTCTPRDRSRAGVVRRQRERDRREAPQQVAHQVRLGVDRARGVERVVEAERPRGARHELRDALRPGRAGANGLKLLSAYSCAASSAAETFQRWAARASSGAYAVGHERRQRAVSAARRRRAPGAASSAALSE